MAVLTGHESWAGLAEFDVIGLRFKDRRAFLCEVVTHLDGVKYGTIQATLGMNRKK